MAILSSTSTMPESAICCGKTSAHYSRHMQMSTVPPPLENLLCVLDPPSYASHDDEHVDCSEDAGGNLTKHCRQMGQSKIG